MRVATLLLSLSPLLTTPICRPYGLYHIHSFTPRHILQKMRSREAKVGVTRRGLMLGLTSLAGGKYAWASGYENVAPVENAATTPADLLAFRPISEQSVREALVLLRSVIETDATVEEVDRVLERANMLLDRHLPLLGEIAAYKKAIQRPPPLLDPLRKLKGAWDEASGAKGVGESLNLVLTPADIERMELLETLCEGALSDLGTARVILKDPSNKAASTSSLIREVITSIEAIVVELP
ncbi:hypothetical protein AAMO2058_000911500 [Amorphochlora amoebiformis]